MLGKNGLNVCPLPVNLNSRVIFDCIFLDLFGQEEEVFETWEAEKILENPLEKDVFLKQ